MNIRRHLLKGLLLAGALPTFFPLAAQAADKLSVVASFSIVADMVQQVGGDRVQVKALVGGNGDTHVYQPTPSDARALSESQLLVVNGAGFEGWMDRLIEASHYKGLVVTATAGLDLDIDDAHEEHAKKDEHSEHEHEDHAKKDGHSEHEHEDHAKKDGHSEHEHEKHAKKDGHSEHEHEKHAKKDGHSEHEHEEHAKKDGHSEHEHEDHAKKDEHSEHEHEEHAKKDDHHDHEGHDHHGLDPHGWQSLEHARIYVDNITKGLVKADPQNASFYQANAKRYLAEIDHVDAEIKETIARLPQSRRSIVTTHDAFGHFGATYGLTFLAPVGMNTQSEASAGDVAKLIRQIREEKISAVFAENVTDQRLLNRITEETGARIGGSLYSDALSEPGGPAATYLDMMRHNLRVLASALGV